MDKTSVIIVVVALFLSILLRMAYVKYLEPNITEKTARVLTVVGYSVVVVLILIFFAVVFFS